MATVNPQSSTPSNPNPNPMDDAAALRERVRQLEAENQRLKSDRSQKANDADADPDHVGRLKRRAEEAERQRDDLITKQAQLGQALQPDDDPENSRLADGTLAPGAKVQRAMNRMAGEETGALASEVQAGHPITSRQNVGDRVDPSKR